VLKRKKNWENEIEKKEFNETKKNSENSNTKRNAEKENSEKIESEKKLTKFNLQFSHFGVRREKGKCRKRE